MKANNALCRENARLAKKTWPSQVSATHIRTLKSLTDSYKFSVNSGDLIAARESLVRHAYRPDKAGSSAPMRRNSCRSSSSPFGTSALSLGV
jgi:hypothetical protein